MAVFRDECSVFIKDESTPVKKKHSENVEKYLEKFINFPGALSIFSIFFISTELIKNRSLALFGVVLIITSLLIAINIFRQSINNDKYFLTQIINIEQPMVDFISKFTKFSRKEIQQEELEDSYLDLEKSYGAKGLKVDNTEINKKIDFIYSQINFSFWLLVFGVIFCFLSAIIC